MKVLSDQTSHTLGHQATIILVGVEEGSMLLIPSLPSLLGVDYLEEDGKGRPKTAPSQEE